MPLIDVTLPAGAVPADAAGDLSAAVVAAVLRWAELPQTNFFRAATWVRLHEAAAPTFTTGAGPHERAFLVQITALSGLLDERRHEGLAAELTGILRTASGSADDEGTVWTIVQDIPEGSWSVNGQLTRAEHLAPLIASGHAEIAEAGSVGATT